MTLGGRLPDGRGGEIVLVRMPGTKLIWAPTLGHFQLFDLVRDPGEREDRWGDGAPAAPLAHLLSEWRGAAPGGPAGPAPPGVGGGPRGRRGGGRAGVWGADPRSAGEAPGARLPAARLAPSTPRSVQ